MSRGASRSEARIVWLSAIALFLCLPACQRLNPDWCSKAERCSAGEICDPTTNTCRRPEAGVPDGRSDRGRRDGVAGRDLFDGDAVPRDHAVADRPAPCSGASFGWTCADGTAWLCGDLGPREGRICPLGSCAGGHCQLPLNPTPCKKDGDCPGQWLCTLLLQDQTTPEQICAAPVKGTLSPALCATGLDCATGLCTSGGQCYYACDNQTDCGDGFDCKTATVAVEGVTVGVTTCEQL
jgi:hypothetical protein